MSEPLPAPLRDASAGAAAAGAAVVAMAGAAAAGLALTGAAAAGSLRSMTAAVVVLAGGGPVDVSLAGGPGGLTVPVSVAGVVHVLPLGVTFAGLVAFALALLLPLRRRPALPLRRLATRAGAAAGLFPVLLTLVSLAGHGRLALAVGQRTAGQMPGTLPGAGGGFPALGSGGFPGGLPGAAPGLGGVTGPTALAFDASAGSTVLAGLVWVLAALAVCRLAAVRRPAAAWAVGTVLTAVVAVALLGGLVAAAAADHPARLLGAVLLAAPNAVFIAVTRGLGVPWHSAVGGSLGTSLHGQPDALPGTGAVAGLPGSPAAGWVLPVLGAALLLATGLLAAARAPAPAGWPGRLRAAARLALAWGVTLPVLTALAGFSAAATASVFGRHIPVADLGLGGDVAVAIPVGLALGAAGGLAGAVLLAAVRQRRGGGWDGRRAGRRERPAELDRVPG
jgi:hypothetical protein